VYDEGAAGEGARPVHNHRAMDEPRSQDRRRGEGATSEAEKEPRRSKERRPKKEGRPPETWAKEERRTHEATTSKPGTKEGRSPKGPAKWRTEEPGVIAVRHRASRTCRRYYWRMLAGRPSKLRGCHERQCETENQQRRSHALHTTPYPIKDSRVGFLACHSGSAKLSLLCKKGLEHREKGRRPIRTPDLICERSLLLSRLDRLSAHFDEDVLTGIEVVL
jgi:hypothetical protein